MKMTIEKDKDGGDEYLLVDGDDRNLLLNNPLLNKGNSFSSEEREQFKLTGLLSAAVLTLEQELEKHYLLLNQKNEALEKHVYLRALQDNNETLFYALIKRYIEELMPLIYTPAVGLACQKFSQIFQRPRGVFISFPDRNKIDEILSHRYFQDIEIIVVTDGGRILGLGDLGACGMGIPIGKLSLYTACAGIPPYKTLPILLDAGTNNQLLLDDPDYLGWRHPRISDKEYDEFLEKFIQAVRTRFPNVLLQWEDFAQSNALKLLERYREKVCSFNDDIQGTAAVVVGALLAATKASGISLDQHRIVIVGAGSAGIGISNLIMDAMVDLGLDISKAYNNIFLIDRNGLITDQVPSLEFQKPFIKNVAELRNWKISNNSNISLLETVTNAKATVLIGVSGQPNIFTSEIIKQMANNCDRPIIFPLSNPTAKAEAHPHDIITWTNGRAIVGAGSPFPPYDEKGYQRQRRIDQVNNAYVFPGVGLGICAVQGTTVTNKLFLVAAKAIADLSPAKVDPEANLLPSLKDIHKVSRQIAIIVAKELVNRGLSRLKNMDEAKIVELVDNCIWRPEYLPYRDKKD